MSDRFEILDPRTFPNWDQLISPLKGTFFHSSGWASVLSDSYGYAPIAFAGFRKDELTAVLTCMEVRSYLTGNRCVSMPFSDYCVPIAREGANIEGLLEFAIRYGQQRSWRYLEIRGKIDDEGTVPSSSRYYLHSLDLSPGEENTFSRFRENTRRNIRKAERKGVTTTMSQSLDSIREFYRLNCITRRDHNLPPQPYHFFRHIYDHVISKGHGVVILADYLGKTIAGGVFFHFGSEAIYKYGASDKTFQEVRPNNVVMWEAIRWYCSKRVQSFSFGRTEPGNEGLRRFKLSYGAVEHPLYYYRYDFKREHFQEQDVAEKKHEKAIFKSLPIPILRLMGRLVYRHVA